jgi:hypothetical protein
MKSLTSTAIVALTAGVIGLAGSIPAATAQQQPQPPAGQGQQLPRQMQPFGNGHFTLRPGMGFRHNQQMWMGNAMRGPAGRNDAGGLLGLVCSERGAERLEIALVRLSYRLDLTAEQQPLFDDLRSTALTAQTTFADDCAAARPAAANPAPAANGDTAAAAPATPPDPVARLRAQVALDKARVAALESVLPKFEALYQSLSDAQKAAFTPERRQGPMQGFRRGPGFPGMNRPGLGFPGMMQPGQPMQPGMMAPPPGPDGGKPDTPPATPAPQT